MATVNDSKIIILCSIISLRGLRKYPILATSTLVNNCYLSGITPAYLSTCKQQFGQTVTRKWLNQLHTTFFSKNFKKQMRWIECSHIVEFHCIVTEIDRNWYIFCKVTFLILKINNLCLTISYISGVWNVVVAEFNITTVNDLCMTSVSTLKVKYCCSSEAFICC